MSFVKLPVLRHGLIVRDQALLAEDDVRARIEQARRLMKKKNVSSLLVYGDPTVNGAVSYLTNYPCFGLGRRATVVLGETEGPFLFTAEPSRNLPKVRLLTTCDLEKTRQFLTLGCERARKLAGDGRIGLVGLTNLPAGLVKDTAGLTGLATEDVTGDFALLTAAKDTSALQAQERSIGMVNEGFRLLAEQLETGSDLWEIAAYLDYQLRRAGCEDTNILLGSGAGPCIRPGYPARVHPRPGDTVAACIAVMYARQWGMIGRTLSVGAAASGLGDLLAKLADVQEHAAAGIRTGMTLGEIEAAIADCGRQSGLTFANDLTMAAGIGYDLHEYPRQSEDRVIGDMVLQVAMTVDDARGFTGMLIDMLHVQDSGSVWMTQQRHP